MTATSAKEAIHTQVVNAANAEQEPQAPVDRSFRSHVDKVETPRCPGFLQRRRNTGQQRLSSSFQYAKGVLLLVYVMTDLNYHSWER